MLTVVKFSASLSVALVFFFLVISKPCFFLFSTEYVVTFQVHAAGCGDSCASGVGCVYVTVHVRVCAALCCRCYCFHLFLFPLCHVSLTPQTPTAPTCNIATPVSSETEQNEGRERAKGLMALSVSPLTLSFYIVLRGFSFLLSTLLINN